MNLKLRLTLVNKRYLHLNFISTDTNTNMIFKRRQVASIIRSVGLSVCLQNEIYLDETHGSKHLNGKCLL